jgi:hypothetical protein
MPTIANATTGSPGTICANSVPGDADRERRREDAAGNTREIGRQRREVFQRCEVGWPQHTPDQAFAGLSIARIEYLAVREESDDGEQQPTQRGEADRAEHDQQRHAACEGGQDNDA